MISEIYPYLILTGATIGAVLFTLWRQARRISRINIALIRLNEQLDFDTPAFLRAAWELLAQAGLQGISWKLDWFGISVEGQEGKQAGESVTREIQVEETRLVVTLFQPGARGERRYFNEALAETFFLLLRTDMWIKAGAVQATFMQMSKLNLFLLHDMKNLAQFIQLMDDQLATVPSDNERRETLKYLREAAPLMRNRADRIVRTLTLRQPQDIPAHGPIRSFRLRDEIEQLCRLYHLDCRISGAAEVGAPGNTLDSALDNILKNYSDIAQRDARTASVIHIGIAENAGTLEITIEAPEAPPIAGFERLFEPFWSSDPAGLGIGLYQAKNLLEMHHGSLSAHETPSGRLQFRIVYPTADAAQTIAGNEFNSSCGESPKDAPMYKN
ncbi:MAG: sensor histidine kinase [Sulfuricella sp.]